MRLFHFVVSKNLINGVDIVNRSGDERCWSDVRHGDTH